MSVDTTCAGESADISRVSVCGSRCDVTFSYKLTPIGLCLTNESGYELPRGRACLDQ
jgi:hypothetical protein